MRAKFLILYFIFCGSVSFAQNLTLPELFSMCNKSNWDEVNEYMLKRGWDYYSSSKGDDTHYNTITWAYNKESYSDKAQGWFYLYTFEDFPNKISYSFSNKPSYTIIKGGINAAGMKLIDNSIDNNEISTKYGGANFIVTVTTEKRESEENNYGGSSVTAYSITVIKKAGVYDTDNGLKKTYDTNGNLESEYTLKDNKLNGVAKAYYINGNVKIISNFLNGAKQGKSKEYDEEGALTAEYNYVNGEPTGLYKIYENGKLKIVGNFLAGKKNGLFKIYDEDGNLDKEYAMKDDALNGSYIEYYYKDNKLILKNSGQYLNDVKNGLWQFVKFTDKGIDLLSSYKFVNGTPDGAFKEVSKDSIIFGSYQNGLLNGKYKIYSSLWSYITGEFTGDSTGAILTTSGSYYNGERSGNWRHYSLTKVLRSEGRYSKDKKTGEWKYYYDNILKADKEDEYEPYSKQLYRIENYENGKLNGKYLQYSSLQRIPIQCDTSNYKDKNPFDTCYTMKYEKSSQVAYFKNDELNGQFEYKDSAGVIRYKGNFINGEKDGFWIESYTSDGFLKLDGFYMYKKGNYSSGKRTGQWTKQWNGFSDENKIETIYGYTNGLLDGKTIDYHENGKPSTVYQLEIGNLKSVDVYDSLGINIIRTYIIRSETGSFYKCFKIETNQDGSKISQEYWVKKNNPEPINPEFFELYFAFSTGKRSDGTTGYPDGQFKIFNSSDKLLVEGVYYKEEKRDTWKTYFYDVNIFVEQNYVNGVGGLEKYIEISTGKQFTGKYIQKFDNGKVKFEFKISDGLRNGKSIYYDESGKVVKIEKYSKGILI